MILLAFQEVRLVPDGTLFIHIALILLMIWVLNRTFFRPINRVLEERARNSGGRSSAAQELLKQVSDKQTAYEQTMLKARSEGYELIERERAEAAAVRQEKVSAVKQEAAQMVTTQTEELNRQSVEAKAAIARQAEQLAERISSNILKTT
jgi:F-type H+-transporting ATPase subunit b